MVAPPSFESPIPPITAALQTGATQGSGLRQTALQRSAEPAAPPAQPRPPASGPGAPVRGERPLSQSLSSPFVAQFIAQEINPEQTGSRNRAETARAFDAFRRAIANAEQGRDPER